MPLTSAKQITRIPIKLVIDRDDLDSEDDIDALTSSSNNVKKSSYKNRSR